MSYSIVFETKIVRLSDGRIIHFSRSGCNNDNCGRTRDEFTAKIYDEADFVKYAEKFKENSAPYKETNDFDVKIGSRYASVYDYGEHLLRMLKRATDYTEFINSRTVRASYCEYIQLIEPERRKMTTEEFGKVFYKLLYSGKPFNYSRMTEHPDVNDEQLIAELLEQGKPMEFYIGKSYK